MIAPSGLGALHPQRGVLLSWRALAAQPLRAQPAAPRRRPAPPAGRQRRCLAASEPLWELGAAAATLSPVLQDAAATAFAAAGALAVVKGSDLLATRKILDRARRRARATPPDSPPLPATPSPPCPSQSQPPRPRATPQKLTRKLVHIVCGPAFVAAWVLYSSRPEARCWAALVPALNGVRLLLIGARVLPPQSRRQGLGWMHPAPVRTSPVRRAQPAGWVGLRRHRHGAEPGGGGVHLAGGGPQARRLSADPCAVRGQLPHG